MVRKPVICKVGRAGIEPATRWLRVPSSRRRSTKT